jgi:Tol biopolymer transport system component
MRTITLAKIGSMLGVIALLASCDSMKKVAKPTEAAPGTTGNAQSLIRVTSDPIPEFYPQLSPDGSKLIFHTRDNNKPGMEKWSVVMMNVGQPGRIPLVGAFTLTPSFYPDSKTIAYAYVKPTKPVIAKSLTDGSAGINYIASNSMGDFDSSPKVSPDGKKIAFHTKFGDTYQISVMDATGMNPSILTEGTYPSWHPKATSLLYTKRVGKFDQVFQYDFKSGQSTQLTSGDFNNSDPSYSKDGRTIVFSSTRDNENEHIFIMSENGSNITQLTTGNTRNGMPIFAPNNVIYFCSNAGTKASKVEWNSSDIWTLTPIMK